MKRSLFTGKRAQWTLLFRRLQARFESIRGLEIVSLTRDFSLEFQGVRIGTLKVLVTGIRITLQFRKNKRLARYHFTITEASQIDSEFFSVLKVAMSEARSAKARSS